MLFFSISKFLPTPIVLLYSTTVPWGYKTDLKGKHSLKPLHTFSFLHTKTNQNGICSWIQLYLANHSHLS